MEDGIIFGKLINFIVNLFGNNFADIFVVIILSTAVASFIVFNKNRRILANMEGLKEFNSRWEELKEIKSGEERIYYIKESRLFGEDEESDLYFCLMDYMNYYSNNKVIPKAELFFTRNKIINEASYRSVSNIIPGALTSLGVLGTFLGLQEGTSRLDNLEPEVIEATIQGLMQDMSLAFITSIFGILTSLLWLVFDRKIYSKNLKIYNEFIENINKLIFEESTDSILKDMLKKNKEIEAAVKSVATDLSLELGKSFENLVEDKLLPGLEDSINKGFGSSISGMSQEIKASTNEKIGEEISKISDVINNFRDEFDDLKENEFKELRLTLEEVNLSNKDFIENFRDINIALERTVDYYSEINEDEKYRLKEYSNIVEGLVESSSNISKNLEASREESEKLLSIAGANNKIIEELSHMSDDLVELEIEFNKKIGGFSQDISNLKDSISKASGDFEENINSANKYMEEKLGATIGELDESIRKLSEDMSSDLEELSMGLSENLKNNVLDMEKILKENRFEFGEDLSSSLKKTFNSFDENLSIIYNGLNGTILELDTVMKRLPLSITSIYNEMNEHVEKISNILDENKLDNERLSELEEILKE